MRVLVLGSTGLLGSVLSPILEARGHTVIRHGFSCGAEVHCDLTETSAMTGLVKVTRPDSIVNLVAATNVDECELDKHRAFLLNTKVVENIVEAISRSSGIFLTQISTDHVYDGPALNTEENVRLTNTYALTKYGGELAARGVSSAVLRTNFFGLGRRNGRRSFSEWVLDRLRAGTPFTAFEDVIVTPLLMETLCEFIGLVIERQVPGVYNLGSKGAMSKADLAVAIAAEYGLPSSLMNRGTTADAKLLAYRPRNMSMDCTRFEAVFSVRLPSLPDEISKMKRIDHAITK